MNLRTVLSASFPPPPCTPTDWPQYRGVPATAAPRKKSSKPWSGDRAEGAVESAARRAASAPSRRRRKSFHPRPARIERRAAGGARWRSTRPPARSSGPLPLDAGSTHGGGDSGTPDNKGGDGPRSTPTTDGTHVFTLLEQARPAAASMPPRASLRGHRTWSQEHAGRNIQWQNAASPLARRRAALRGRRRCWSVAPGDRSQGRARWSGKPSTRRSPTPRRSAATILGQRQIIFFVQSGLLAVEPKTRHRNSGATRSPSSVSTAASPVVSDDMVYCSAGYGVGAGAVQDREKRRQV